MKARYIIVLLFSLLGLSAQAQSIELIGLVPSADGGVSGRMILAKVNAGGEEIQNVQVVSFSLRDGKAQCLQTIYHCQTDIICCQYRRRSTVTSRCLCLTQLTDMHIVLNLSLQPEHSIFLS